jgi:NAD(P)-dependent dehydrogenase (short-subunit alcohol dehydrogenase family)
MSLKNKIVVMTGATSGLGIIAAQHALKEGAQLIVLYRNEELLKPLTNNGNLIPIKVDLSSKKSILAACQQIRASYTSIDMLINNAGLWVFGDKKTTEEGHELTFMVNVIAPWLLIHELKPLLNKSPDPKVINTASALHQGNINFEDIEFNEKFSGFKAYRQSKLSLILLTRYLAIQNPEWTIVSQHPGLVSTGLGREGGWLSNAFFRLFGKSPEKGAATLIMLMEENKLNIKSGEYYANSKLAKTSTPQSNNIDIATRLARHLENFK